MTKETIDASDVIGKSYYIYSLSSSNNNPSLNGTINITCTVTNVYGQAVSGKSITLYLNGTSKGSQTTTSNGTASWNSISMTSEGLQVFNVENTKIEVYVDNKISKSSTTGLVKNDGTIMTSGTGASNYSAGNHTHSGYLSATKVTSWQSTPSDSNVPSEKLVKDTLDTKLGTSIGSASGRILTTTTDGVIQASTSLSDSKVSAQHTYQYLDNTVLTQSDFNIDVDVALKNISDSIGTAIQYIQQ